LLNGGQQHKCISGCGSFPNDLKTPMSFVYILYYYPPRRRRLCGKDQWPFKFTTLFAGEKTITSFMYTLAYIIIIIYVANTHTHTHTYNIQVHIILYPFGWLSRLTDDPLRTIHCNCRWTVLFYNDSVYIRHV